MRVINQAHGDGRDDILYRQSLSKPELSLRAMRTVVRRIRNFFLLFPTPRYLKESPYVSEPGIYISDLR